MDELSPEEKKIIYEEEKTRPRQAKNWDMWEFTQKMIAKN